MTFDLFAKSTCLPESAASRLPRSGADGPKTGPSSPEDHPASRLPLPEPKGAKPTHVISGRRWLGLLKNDSLISRCTRILLERPSWRSIECSLTWKASGTRSGHTLFRLVPLERCTNGIASGLLPTLAASDARMARILTDRIRSRAYRTSGNSWRQKFRETESSNLMLTRSLALELEYLTGERNERPLLDVHFAEKFMGYPTNWTELPPSATPSSPRSQPSS